MDEQSYEIGDWVVHRKYGVGQINGIETRPINQNPTECFRVETNGFTYWFPMLKKNPRIRPVNSEAVIEKIEKILRKQATSIETDKDYWKSRIDEIESADDLLQISRIIRDLSVQKSIRKLNQTEQKALERFKNALLREWAAINQIEISEVKPLLQDDLQEGIRMSKKLLD